MLLLLSIFTLFNKPTPISPLYPPLHICGSTSLTVLSLSKDGEGFTLKGFTLKGTKGVRFMGFSHKFLFRFPKESSNLSPLSYPAKSL